MKSIKVNFGQSIFDIATMQYGSVDQVWKIIDDNKLSEGLDTDLFGGETLMIRMDEPVNNISGYFKRFSFVVNNSDQDSIPNIVDQLVIVLKEIGNEIVGGDGFILIEVYGGITPYFFEWKDQATEAVVSNSQNLVGASSGTYKVKVTDSNGTEVELMNLTISVADTNVYLMDDFGNLILDGNGNPIVVN